jgi:hypothetical protein
MNHILTRWVFDGRWSRLQARQSVLCTVMCAALLACAWAPGSAHAQAQLVQVPFGLAGSPAWRENIALGVKLWVLAHENARRTLLLGRCTSLERGFPRQASPAMVAASTEVFRWMTGEAYAALPPEPHSAALRDVLPILAQHAFTDKEIAPWEALRNSPQGRRGVAAHEIEAAFLEVSDQLTEVTSGQPWGWPLARLVRLADAHGFNAELNGTFNQTLGAGAATKLRSISPVPGETPADEQFLEQVAMSGEQLAEAFVKRLRNPDRNAYKRVQQIGILERWTDLTQALQHFTQEPAVKILRGQPDLSAETAPVTVAAFCDRFGLSSCQPGGELEIALTKYVAAKGEALRSDVTMTVARQVVRGLASSGCP